MWDQNFLLFNLIVWMGCTWIHSLKLRILVFCFLKEQTLDLHNISHGPAKEIWWVSITFCIVSLWVWKGSFRSGYFEGPTGEHPWASTPKWWEVLTGVHLWASPLNWWAVLTGDHPWASIPKWWEVLTRGPPHSIGGQRSRVFTRGRPHSTGWHCSRVFTRGDFCSLGGSHFLMYTNLLSFLHVFEGSRHKHVIDSWCFVQVHRCWSNISLEQRWQELSRQLVKV